MTIKNYREPGVDVILERSAAEQQVTQTLFNLVFVGPGVSTRSKQITKSNLKADTDAWPLVTLTFDISGDVNSDKFSKMGFKLGQIEVTKSAPTEDGSTTVTLEPETDYTTQRSLALSSSSGFVTVTINVTNEEVNKTDLMYEVNMTATMADSAFDLVELGTGDRFISSNMLGPVVLEENDAEFYNDVMISTFIANKLNVERYFYQEVPRNFGQEPEFADWKAAIDSIYFWNDAYRIVPLTNDIEVINYVNSFIKDTANPTDQHERVAFVSYPTDDIDDMNSIDELVEKVGGLSQELNNRRVLNVFGAKELEMKINGISYVLPEYYLACAVAAYDASVGEVEPISRATISVFDRFVGPRFRPNKWNMLAKQGVCIVKQDSPNEPVVIRHQLTTAQSDNENDQEYSVVKNYDAVIKRLRDRFNVYAGQYNITTGYMEMLDGTMTSEVAGIIEDGLAASLTVQTTWRRKDDGKKTSLATVLAMETAYPGNNLDIYLII